MTEIRCTLVLMTVKLTVSLSYYVEKLVYCMKKCVTLEGDQNWVVLALFLFYFLYKCHLTAIQSSVPKNTIAKLIKQLTIYHLCIKKITWKQLT